LSQTLRDVCAEIEALHILFTTWFNGTVSETVDEFTGNLTSHFHPDFEIILPSGTAMQLDTLLATIVRARGSNPDFPIEIHDVRVLGEWPQDESGSGLIMAGYVEAQFGARNSIPPENLRISTVLFERTAGRLLWRHVHETALDPD